MKLRLAFCFAALSVCLVPILSAQDPTKVDSKHYTIVSENDQVRILKVHYGPHEKSVMHSHPAAVAVFLTDAKGQFNFPDGKKQEFNTKQGDSLYTPAQTHQPENTSDTPFELILVELKHKPATAAKATHQSAKK